jgi:CheY-like chemotaxis protein
MQILMVHKHAFLADVLSLVLRETSYQVIDVIGPETALRLLTQLQPDIVLMTAQIAVADDYAFLKTCVRLTQKRVAMVVIDVPLLLKPTLHELGVAGFLDIPFALDDLKNCLEMVITSMS